MLYSYGVILALGLLLGLYYFWKKGREEHWNETSLFDAFFLSLLLYWVVGRIVFVILHRESFDSVWTAFALVTHPGIHATSGVLAGIAGLLLTARNRAWEYWRALDLAAPTLALIMIGGALSEVIFGERPLWWRVTALVLAVISFLFVAKVRSEFRFYRWYKGEQSVARDGLASLFYLVMMGLYGVVSGVLFTIDYTRIIVGSLGVVLGLCGIILRRGKKR